MCETDDAGLLLKLKYFFDKWRQALFIACPRIILSLLLLFIQALSFHCSCFTVSLMSFILARINGEMSLLTPAFPSLD